MDNNTNGQNGYFSNEPSKPFTERTAPDASESSHKLVSEPDCTAPQQTVEQQQPAQPAQPSSVQQPVQPAPSACEDYSSPRYYGAYEKAAPAPDYYGTNPHGPVNNFGGYGFYQPPAMPKKKTNKGVVTIIVLLCALVVFGLTGFIIVTFSDKNENQKPDNSYQPNITFTVPSEPSTKPDSSQSSTGKHEESDYSDKKKPDYKGLALNAKPKDADKNSDKYTTETAFDKVSDSVVGIVCYADEVTSVEDCDSQGSGIIISSNGYIITNAHVISNSKTAYIIQVVTSDGKFYNAGVVGYDSRTDIAILKVDNAKGLKAAEFGDSAEIELGEDIIAVGNPGGLDYQNSITKGIVSAVDRKLSSTSLVKYIQTDAAINPGNSGGPIVNRYGQVVGIATSKIVSERYEGMGFAIPSATTKEIVDELVRNSYVTGRVKIGIVGNAVSAATSKSYNLPRGILVSEVSAGGPCDGTELSINDIVTEIDGNKVTSFAEVYEILSKYKPNDKIKIKFYDTAKKGYTETEIILQEDII